jgi:hypothetical protein
MLFLFSDTYTNVTVDTWRTSWSQADLTDIELVEIKAKYSNLNLLVSKLPQLYQLQQ